MMIHQHIIFNILTQLTIYTFLIVLFPQMSSPQSWPQANLYAKKPLDETIYCHFSLLIFQIHLTISHYWDRFLTSSTILKVFLYSFVKTFSYSVITGGFTHWSFRSFIISFFYQGLQAYKFSCFHSSKLNIALNVDAASWFSYILNSSAYFCFLFCSYNFYYF